MKLNLIFAIVFVVFLVILSKNNGIDANPVKRQSLRRFFSGGGGGGGKEILKFFS